MEEKNENEEKNVEEVKAEKGFFSKMFGFIRFCLILVILSFVASLVGIYYFKGARDFVKQNYPEIRIPSYFAHVNKIDVPQVFDEQTPVEEKEVKETIVVTESISEIVEEVPVKTETKVEAPIEAMEEIASEEVVTEPEAKEEQVEAPKQEDKKVAKEEIQPNLEVAENLEIKDSLDGVTLPVAKVEVVDIKDKEVEKQALKQAVLNVEAMNTETNRFNEASFDPIKKAEERVPADKYSSLSVDEKFLDLMNKNSDLVDIAKKMNERIARVEEASVDPVVINAVMDKVSTIETKMADSPSKAINSAMVIALSHLRYAILSGENFVYELDTIKLLATENEKITTELKGLDIFVAGVKNSESLKKEFAEALVKADNFVMTKDAGDLKSKILDKINDVVVIKRVDGRPVDGVLLALYEKTMPLIEKGNISEALVEVNALNDETKKFFETFIKDANDKAKTLEIIDQVKVLVKEGFLAGINKKQEAKQ
ncbi:MAG: hypothetical protein BWY78_00980 [Alphaproteobacteria bacterium ADurb.Bin438]|nr:MAG: hypothetical protein BWY78_00980 [Alphaproteobacteria bacterium ADurb.Bin438]